MKKFLTLFLTLCLLATVVAAFAINSSADEDATEITVTVGQTFSYNDQSGTTDTLRAWGKGGGVSPDGLWKYQFYSLTREIYQDVVYTGSFYAWSKTPGDNGIGYARVRNGGKNFHPGELADIVKVFTCPSGGTIDIQSIVARAAEYKAGGSATPTSFAIYLEDTLIYPTSGEYDTLTSATPRTILVEDVAVQKNQRIYIRIGAMENQASDAVDMENFITYRSVNDEVAEVSSQQGGIVVSRPSDPTGVTLIDTDTNSAPATSTDNNGGMSAGTIVLIVVAGVAVIGIAVAVIVIAKKKKSE